MAKRIITINRMYGSNGRKLGQALAEELGIHYYDRELLDLASQRRGIPYEELVKVDEKRASQWRYPVEDSVQMQPQYRFRPMNDLLFQTESEIIRSLSETEDCIIIGRCANHILRGKCLSVLVHAPFDVRVKTVSKRTILDERSAHAQVKKIDKERRSYYEYFTDEKWLDVKQYDLCIDSNRFSMEQIVSMLKTIYETL
ncbi:MAG: cytidylate kinase-like family protein [Lachnospiraceae bacterium]|nr:cytidylate kinase-like family protein [Lachnospiraceae bacterium]MCI9133033.1 cytidylate kinase-like family protein [Lachnospiraceae bacterium]